MKALIRPDRSEQICDRWVTRESHVNKQRNLIMDSFRYFILEMLITHRRNIDQARARRKKQSIFN